MNIEVPAEIAHRAAQLNQRADSLRAQADALPELLDAPLGNHLVLVPGHHAERLERWWRLVIAER